MRKQIAAKIHFSRLELNQHRHSADKPKRSLMVEAI